MRKIGLGSGFVGFVRIGQILTNLTDTRDWYEVTAVADSSIQLRCIHPCVLVLIQPRSRRTFSTTVTAFFWTCVTRLV